jgi:hypothetical protein
MAASRLASRSNTCMARANRRLDLHWDPNASTEVVELPPAGIERIRNRERKHSVENPDTGERREVTGLDELATYRRRGWKRVPTFAKKLEMIHMQAWYFQVCHFPRLF